MSLDEIFDLTAEGYFNFNNIDLPLSAVAFYNMYAVGNSSMSTLAGRSKDYSMSTDVISKIPNSVLLVVPLLAFTRRAALETGPWVLVCLLNSPLLPRCLKQTRFTLSSTQYTAFTVLPLISRFDRQSYPCQTYPWLAGSNLPP